MTVDLLVVKAAGTNLAIVLDQVLEVASVEEFSRITAQDACLRGAVRYRGKVVPLIDVERCLGVDRPHRFRAPVMLVTQLDGIRVGFLVDDPEDVVPTAPSSFRRLPPLVERLLASRAPYAVADHGGTLHLVIDLPSLLTEERAREALRLAGEALDGKSP